MRRLILFAWLLAACHEPASRSTLASNPGQFVVRATPRSLARAPTPTSAAAKPPTPAPLPVEPTPITSAPEGALPALYASLFEAGHTWQFNVDSVSNGLDGLGRNLKRSSKVIATCQVESVRPARYGLLSKVRCEGFDDVGMDVPLAGEWIATRDGLFHEDENAQEPLDRSLLTNDLMYLSDAPYPYDRRTELDKDPPRGFLRALTHKGKNVCIFRSDWNGITQSDTKVCFGEGTGFGAGSYGWSSKISASVSFSPVAQTKP